MKAPSHFCGRCRVSYDSSSWRRLELIDVMDSQCVRLGLSDWPSGLSIEIRRCVHCGGELARLARADGADP